MRVLVVADLHYNLRQFDWLLRMSAEYDLVIVAGDVLDLAGHVDLDTQIVVLTKYMAKLRALVPVLVCSGNHDLDACNSAGERVAAWLQDLRDDDVRVDGEHVPLATGLVSICPYWDGPSSRADVETFLEQAPRPAVGWIWLYHVPPQGSPVSWTGRGHAGDGLLNQLIDRYSPDLVLCGHVHDSPFRKGGSWIDRLGETWVFNPGRQLGELPTCIELDLERRTACWMSLAGTEDRAIA
jgi:Icc-related predicted phosphoesterase